MPSANSDARLRRNGKQQACEPCRKSKLRCDHTSPVCARCIRRKRSTLCIYLESPMAGKASSPSPFKATSQPSRSPAPSSSGTSTAVASSLALECTDGYGIFREGSVNVGPSTEGFLGSTSYSAIFREHQGHLVTSGVEYIDGSKDPARMKLGKTLPYHGDSDTCAKAAAVRLGIKVLQHFPNKQCSKLLVERFFRAMDDMVMHEPTIKACLDSLWSTYGDCLEEPKNPEKLLAMSEELYMNGREPFDTDFSQSPKEWLKTFTGHQYRWEIVSPIPFKSRFLLPITHTGGPPLRCLGFSYHVADRLGPHSQITRCFEK